VVDLCGLFTSRTFLGINQSDEVSELSIKVTKFRQLKRSNEVTKVTTTLKTQFLPVFGAVLYSASILTGSRGLGSGKLLTRDPTRKPEGFTRTHVLP
jgi:hypothetical protein